MPVIDNSTDGKKQVWSFENVDRDGHFAFTLARGDMNHFLILEKLMEYNQRTWAEIKRETHDQFNKSCHHFLEYDSLSSAAKERISRLRLNGQEDSIFSMRLNNVVRVIGIRQGEKFMVKWYDPKHEFAPSKRK